MRLPSLVFLLTLTLSLIAVTEYACRHLPARNNKGIVDTLARKNFGRDLHGRVPDPLAPIKATISLQALSLQIPAPTSALSNKLPLSKSLPAAPTGGGGSIINQLPPTSASKPLDAAAPALTTSHSAYIAPRFASLHPPYSFVAGVTAFLPLSPPIEASSNPLTAPPESAFLPLSPVIMPTPPPGEATALPSEAFLPLSATAQSPNNPLTAPPESAFWPLYPVITSTPLPETFGVTPLEAFLPLSSTTQSSNNPLVAPTQSAFLPLSPVITPTPPPGEDAALPSEAFLPLSQTTLSSNNPLSPPPESAFLLYPVITAVTAPVTFSVSSTTHSPNIPAPIQSAFLPLSPVITPTPSPGEAAALPSEAFLPLSQTTQSSDNILYAPIQSAFLPLSPVITPTPPPGEATALSSEAFLPLSQTTQSSDNILFAPIQSAFLPLSPVITPTSPPGEATALPSEAFLPLSQTTQSSDNIIYAPAESAFLQLDPVINSAPPPLTFGVTPLEAFLPLSSTTQSSNNPLAASTQSAFLPLSPVISPRPPPVTAGAAPAEASLPLSPLTQSSNNPPATPLSAFLSIAGSSSTLPRAQPFAAIQSAFLPLSPVISPRPPPVTAGAAPAEASLPLSPLTQSSNNPPAAPLSAFLSIAGSSSTLPRAQPSGTPYPTLPEGAFLPLDKDPGQTASGGAPGQALTSGGQALTSGGQALTNEGTLGPTVTSGGVPGQTVASGGNPEASANFPGATTMPPAQTTGTFQGESYLVGSNGLVVIDGTSFNTATPTAATLRGGKVVVVWPTGSVSIQEAQDRAPSKKIAITPKEYIIGSFVPTILAVVYSIPWHLLASAIQAIEPFYQLQRPEGVTAQDSIALDYRASVTVMATFSAITKGHFLVWLSGLISLLVLVLAPIASQTVFISFIGSCTATSGRQACSPELGVYPVAARVLQGILASIAVSTLALAAAIKRRKSGLYSSPLSIAGLAILFQNDHVVESFRRLNPYCPSSKMIRSSLQGHRFRMTSYVDNDGSSSYGLVMCYDDPATVQTNHQTAFRGGKKYASVAVDASDASDERIPLRPQRTVSDFFIHPGVIVAFALFVAGLQALIIYYNHTGGDTAFERFMDSQSFGVGFLFTALGVILKLYWCLLDNDIRNMEPYRQLLAGEVKASDSILLAPHTNPFTGVFYSVRNGHFFNAYFSLVAILCEPLIVALSNIPFKAGLAYIAYRVSTYISIGILSMMLLGILWMLTIRKRTPDLVRRPDTVASILLFICGSTMLDGFKGMSQMDRKDRDATVERWNKRYSMGSVIGVDTVEREGIDESVFVTASEKL